MDQGILAAFFVFCFFCFMVGHYIGQSERRSRRSGVEAHLSNLRDDVTTGILSPNSARSEIGMDDIHSFRKDVEARSRRLP